MSSRTALTLQSSVMSSMKQLWELMKVGTHDGETAANAQSWTAGLRRQWLQRRTPPPQRASTGKTMQVSSPGKGDPRSAVAGELDTRRITDSLSRGHPQAPSRLGSRLPAGLGLELGAGSLHSPRRTDRRPSRGALKPGLGDPLAAAQGCTAPQAQPPCSRSPSRHLCAILIKLLSAGSQSLSSATYNLTFSQCIRLFLEIPFGLSQISLVLPVGFRLLLLTVVSSRCLELLGAFG